MAIHTAPEDERIVAEFEARLQGTLLRPGDDGYDEARTVWNAMVDKRPALIAQCTSAADVVAAVDYARQAGMDLAVKAGGHNVAGTAVCDDGLVIDLSPMKSVAVDPDTKTARVEPGVTMGEFDEATQAHGLFGVGGVISTTGVAGLTLGGGWGWLSRTYGLAIDNLRSVDIVTADGTLRHASETENEDLFWAVRGGGGNFGVVVSFEFELHDLETEVLSGLVLHPFEDAAAVLKYHQEYTAEAPDEVCCYAGIITAPPEPFVPEEVQGTMVTALVICYSGDIEAGEEALRPIREFGNPIVDVVAPHPYAGWQQALDAGYQPGWRNYWKSQFVDHLPEEAIDVIVERAATMEGPLSGVLVEHLGGAISDVRPDATAYRHREARYSFNVFPRWDDPADDEAQIEWATAFHDAMAPFASEGVYVNFLSEEGEERVRSAYGENYGRLTEIKNRYDPENLFQTNQNIQPTA